MKVHDEVSISLSFTWYSAWNLAAIDAHKFDHRLRRFGLLPAAPKLFPASNRVKSIGQRALARIAR